MSKSAKIGIKIVISDPKLGKTIQREYEEDKIRPFLGKKIGDTIGGNLIDYPGYEFKITGGSDEDGTPMRPDVRGPVRKRILIMGTSISSVIGFWYHQSLKEQERSQKFFFLKRIHAELKVLHLQIPIIK